MPGPTLVYVFCVRVCLYVRVCFLVSGVCVHMYVSVCVGGRGGIFVSVVVVCGRQQVPVVSSDLDLSGNILR